jgi:hypothetical protein
VGSLTLNLMPVQQAYAVNLVTNGGFTPTGTTISAYIGNGVTINGWNFPLNVDTPSDGHTGYNLIVPDGTAIGIEFAAKNNTPYGTASRQLITTPGQVVNSVPVDGVSSGWYVAADAYYDRGALQQTLNNLAVGKQYTVSFSQASGQQNGYGGAFTEVWNVGFGATTQKSAVMTSASGQIVSGWQQQSLTFTADATSQVLSFLAESGNNVPPFALLSGVSVEAVPSKAVPEPETYVGTLISVGLLGTFLKSRLAKKKLSEND